jgi:hypothetical protein
MGGLMNLYENAVINEDAKNRNTIHFTQYSTLRKNDRFFGPLPALLLSSVLVLIMLLL